MRHSRARAGLAAAGAALVVGAASCAATHLVQPLGKGNGAVTASVGGPLVQVLGADIPAPILTVGGAYGVRDDVEVMLNGDVTAAVYGDLHLEPGVVYHPLVRAAGAVPTVTVAGSIQFLTDFTATRAYPQLSATAAWRLGRRFVAYAGVDDAVAFGSPTRVVVGPLAGGQLIVGRWALALEAKWLAPYYDVAPTAPDWISPDSHGYLSVLFGVTYRIGGAR